MDNSQGFFITPFSQGLNTEIPSVADSPLTTSDEDNCVLDTDGSRRRRPAVFPEIGGEALYDEEATDQSDRNNIDGWKGYVWKNAGKTFENFLAVYDFPRLWIFEFDTKPLITSSKLKKIVDISAYAVDAAQAKLTAPRMQDGAGVLLVVSENIRPFYVSYNAATGEFSTELITLRYRDFEGLPEEYEADEMPPKAELDANIEAKNKHLYNLINQGWTIEQINNFVTNQSRYPANNMQWFIGKNSTGDFDIPTLLKKYFGNTQAPRGHCILDVFRMNRSEASGIYNDAGTSDMYFRFNDYSVIPYKDWFWVFYTNINSMSKEFTNSKGQATQLVFNLQEQKRTTSSIDLSSDVWNDNFTISVYGFKDNAWTLIETVVEAKTTPTFTKTIPLDTNSTEYEKYRVDASWLQGSCTVTITAKLILSDADAFKYTGSIKGSQDVAYSNGRFFYLAGTKVLFSPVLGEDLREIGNCYQMADPTSEEMNQLVATDGGSLNIQTLGNPIGLRTFNNVVFIFSDDSVWALVPQSGQGLDATSYATIKVSNTGAVSKESIIETPNALYYLSSQGIFRISLNQTTGSTYVLENISLNTIQKYYKDITPAMLATCRGTYDSWNNRILWMFRNLENTTYYSGSRSGETLEDNATKAYTSFLVYSEKLNAFSKYSIIPAENENSNIKHTVSSTIMDICSSPVPFVQQTEDIVVTGEHSYSDVDAGVQVDDPVEVHYEDGSVDIVTVGTNEDTRDNSYASFVVLGAYGREIAKIVILDFLSLNFKDALIGLYDSYLVSSPFVAREPTQIKRMPILNVVFKRTEMDFFDNGTSTYPSGCKINLRWDWAISDKSNRWDSEVNGYILPRDAQYLDNIVSRLRMRGRGSAVQICVKSVDGKNFRVLGMSLKMREA